MSIGRALAFAVPLTFFLACSPLSGDELKTYHSGPNTVEIRTFSSRTTSEEEMPVALLHEKWDTDSEIRWDISAVLALFSQQVYNPDQETLTHLFRGMGFTKWILVRSQDQSKAGHVLTDGDVAVVVFRGTQPTAIRDWLSNLDVDYITTANGRFHSGFTAAYGSVRTEITEFLSETKPKQVWVTGHSLGGAMAVACAIDLRSTQAMPSTLVTFGQPRYADAIGAKWIDGLFRGRYVRFVRGNDIVPQVPFTVPLLFPYSHAGRFIAITDGGVKDGHSVDALVHKSLGYQTSGYATVGYTAEIKEPIYQPIEERGPLSEEQFRSLLAPQATQVSSIVGADCAYQTVQFIPILSYLTDHLMDGYLALVRRYRDHQQPDAVTPRRPSGQDERLQLLIPQSPALPIAPHSDHRMPPLESRCCKAASNCVIIGARHSTQCRLLSER